MMYGFGDDDSPLPETIDLLQVSQQINFFSFAASPLTATPLSFPHCFAQEIVIEYSTGVLRKAMDLATLRGKSKPPLKGVGAVTAEDIMAVVRRDPKKYDRVKELLELQKELKLARTVIDSANTRDVEALMNLVKEVEEGDEGAPADGNE